MEQQRPWQAATARLWQRHRLYLHWLGLRWLRGDRAEAEDAVADVICKASEILSDSRHVIVNERAWLTRMMHNRCMDIHRSRCGIQPLETAPGAIDESAEGTRVDRSAEELMLNRELGEIIRQALAALPDGLRGPAMMRLVDDEPYASISKRFRISEANARKRIQQAREILRRRLELYLNGGERQVSTQPPPDAQKGQARTAGRP